MSDLSGWIASLSHCDRCPELSEIRGGTEALALLARSERRLTLLLDSAIAGAMEAQWTELRLVLRKLQLPLEAG